MVQASSAAGILCLLTDSDVALKEYALSTLNQLVPVFWAEISEHVALIESLYESEELKENSQNIAALLASKIYYYLGEYDEALSFALSAGPAFQAENSVSGSEEYVETVVSKAIDHYIAVCNKPQGGSKDTVDPKLLFIIEGIFERCIAQGEFKQAIGIALESRRLDIIRRIFDLKKDISLLSYAMDAVIEGGFSLSYRDQVLSFLYPLFPHPSTGDGAMHAHIITRLLVTLDKSSLIVSLLASLVPKHILLAYQFAFDFVEAASQDLLDSVRNELPQGDNDDTKPVFSKLKSILTGQDTVKLYLQFLKQNNQVDLLILKNTKDALEPRSSIYHSALTLQNAFMHAGTTSDVFLRDNLEWLALASNWSKFSATAALGVIHKGYFEQGMTILGPYLPQAHGESAVSGAAYSEGGALYALGLINAGCDTAVTTYLRDALKASQGEVVQHGAALGLGVAAAGSKNMDIFEELKTVLFTDSAVAGEAAGFAMGLVMMGTAVPEAVQEMLTYARETQHEKIIRGLAIGLAFIFYGRQEEADTTVQGLLKDKDPILRYGGVYTLALAYAGTANNDAVRKLLHIAVSDTSDDVRRAAVTSLAFLLYKAPSQVPRIVQLLSESYNPHVRCGATLALGIACAGTGLQDAVDILGPMTRDSVDFVRQGALTALGMILVQQSEASSPSIANTRSLYKKVISDKHEDPVARFGAAIGQGLIDAGGRNVTISLETRAGSQNATAIMGMVLFCQFWYWYPLAHCICLAFQPTAVIGVTGDLKVPKFDFMSNAKPSLFAYPQPTKPPKKETVAKVATAVLSTTAKAKAREKKKAGEEGADGAKKDSAESIEVDREEKAAGEISPLHGSISNLEDDSKAAGKKREPTFEFKPNFSRVTPAQISHISFPQDGRYQPVRPVSFGGQSKLPTSAASSNPAGLLQDISHSRSGGGGGGIVVLTDSRPSEPSEYIQLDDGVTTTTATEPEDTAMDTSGSAPSGVHIALDENAPEASPPSPFEYPFGADT